jgi:long-chain fatty acid transport protein
VPIPERFTKDKLVVGIGLVGPPFGVKYRWPNDGPFNTTTVTASLPLLDIKPTVAYQLTDSLSVGVGMDIYTFSSFIGEGQYEQKFVGSGPLAGQQVEVNGSDTSLGFNLSLMYTPQAFMKTIKDPITEEEVSKPQVSIGLVYRSQATLHLNGNLLVNGAAISSASTTAVLRIVNGNWRWMLITPAGNHFATLTSTLQLVRRLFPSTGAVRSRL